MMKRTLMLFVGTTLALMALSPPAQAGRNKAVVEAIRVGGDAEYFEVELKLDRSQRRPRKAMAYYAGSRNSIVVKPAVLSDEGLKIEGEDPAFLRGKSVVVDGDRLQLKLWLKGNNRDFADAARCHISKRRVRCRAKRSAFGAPAPKSPVVEPKPRQRAPERTRTASSDQAPAALDEGARLDAETQALLAELERGSSDSAELAAPEIPETLGTALVSEDPLPDSVRGREDGDLGRGLFGAALTLFALLVAAFGALYLRRRKVLSGGYGDKPLKVISAVGVGSRQSVVLVEALGQPMLLATGERGLQLISRLEESGESVDAALAPPAPAIADPMHAPVSELMAAADEALRHEALEDAEAPESEPFDFAALGAALKAEASARRGASPRPASPPRASTPRQPQFRDEGNGRRRVSRGDESARRQRMLKMLQGV